MNPIVREINYIRHEFRHEPRKVKGRLLEFVYDVPYLAGCGVFPPRHILNQVLQGGGGDAGMSPGASWTPFTLSESEYDELVREILETPVSAFGSSPRFLGAQFTIDHEFDHLTDRFEWLAAVCGNGDRWHQLLDDSARDS